MLSTFDNIDHNKLLIYLGYYLDFDNITLNLLKSYLSAAHNVFR